MNTGTTGTTKGRAAGWALEIRRTDADAWERCVFEDGDAAMAYLAEALGGRRHDWVEVREVRRQEA